MTHNFRGVDRNTFGIEASAGTMDGKDVRFGQAGAALFAVATTGTGTGAASQASSLMAIAGRSLKEKGSTFGGNVSNAWVAFHFTSSWRRAYCHVASILPVITLGPLAEHVLMEAGRTF
jgi:K+-transporting ATPase A subunit